MCLQIDDHTMNILRSVKIVYGTTNTYLLYKLVAFESLSIFDLSKRGKSVFTGNKVDHLKEIWKMQNILVTRNLGWKCRTF